MIISLGKKYIEDNYIEEVSEERAIKLSMNELQLMGITNCDQVYDNDSIFDNPIYPGNAELYDGFCDEHGFDTMEYFLFIARRIELKNEENKNAIEEVEEDITMKNIKIEQINKNYFIVKADTTRFGTQEIMFEGVTRKECESYINRTTKKYVIFGNGSQSLNGTKLTIGQQVRLDLYNTNINEVTELEGLEYKEFTEGHTEGTYTRMYIEITGVKGYKGYSAKLEFSKYENMDEYERSIAFKEDYERKLDVNVTVTGDSKVYDALYEIAKIMERELNITNLLSTCSETSELDNNKFCEGDVWSFEYEHGSMAELKKDIREAFKTAKKELKIK